MTLELRRLHTDLIMCYKFVFNIVQLEFSDVFVFNTSSTRGHRYKFYVSRASANVRRYFLLMVLLTCGTAYLSTLLILIRFVASAVRCATLTSVLWWINLSSTYCTAAEGKCWGWSGAYAGGGAQGLGFQMLHISPQSTIL